MSSLSEPVGRLFLIGFEGDALDRPLERLLRRVRPGGVILFQRNITGECQFQSLVREITKVLLPGSSSFPFLAMDLEGGLVDRLREVLAPLPSARDAARAGLARELGRGAGRELAAFSLNVDFAPVLDLAAPESQEVLGSRAAGDSPEVVARFGEEFLDGLAESGILGCGKHFPGLGSGRKDSHQQMPRIEKKEAELWGRDLFPFRVLGPRLPLMMVAHAAYPELERALSPSSADTIGPLPASLSGNIVSRLLKGRLGFSGLALSDDLEMGGVLEGRSIAEAAVGAVRAGCDALLVCRRPENVEQAFEAVLREAERDSEFRARVDEAAQRVGKIQGKFLGARPPASEPFSDWEGLRREIQELAAEVDRRLASSAIPEKGSGG